MLEAQRLAMLAGSHPSNLISTRTGCGLCSGLGFWRMKRSLVSIRQLWLLVCEVKCCSKRSPQTARTPTASPSRLGSSLGSSASSLCTGRCGFTGNILYIDGKDTKYYHHPIHEFSFTALDSKEKWTAYGFRKTSRGSAGPSMSCHPIWTLMIRRSQRHFFPRGSRAIICRSWTTTRHRCQGHLY